MFGVDPRPISGTGLEPIVQDTYNYVLEWMEELLPMEALINGQVNEYLAQARTRMKTDYDKGKDTQCKPGDWKSRKGKAV